MATNQQGNGSVAAIGLYVMAGFMAVILVASLIGLLFIAENRMFFIGAGLIAAVMGVMSFLTARYFREKSKQKKPSFASYAFEGEFAPKPKTPSKTKK